MEYNPGEEMAENVSTYTDISVKRLLHIGISNLQRGINIVREGAIITVANVFLSRAARLVIRTLPVRTIYVQRPRIL